MSCCLRSPGRTRGQEPLAPRRTHGSGHPVRRRGERKGEEAAAVAPLGPCPGRSPLRGEPTRVGLGPPLPPPPRSAEGRRGAGWRGQAAPGELAAPVTALGGAGRGARDGSPVRSHLLERSMRTPEKSFSPSRNETTRASSMM